MGTPQTMNCSLQYVGKYRKKKLCLGCSVQFVLVLIMKDQPGQEQEL